MKTKIKKMMYGLIALVVLAPALTSAQLNVSNVQTQSALPNSSIMEIVSNFMRWLLGIVGFIGVIGFAIAGILYLTAAGDEDRIATAKRAMTWSIVGVIVALLGVVIIVAAQGLLGAQDSF